MKHAMLLMFLLLLIAVLSSCIPDENMEVELPRGIWRSVDPNIVLYIKPDYQSPIVRPSYLGVYTTESEEIKIFTNFGRRRLILELHRADMLDSGQGITEEMILFAGVFEVHGDEMHYTLRSTSRLAGTAEQPDYGVIIFHRWEDYEPINPDDWFRQGRYENTESELPPDMEKLVIIPVNIAGQPVYPVEFELFVDNSGIVEQVNDENIYFEVPEGSTVRLNEPVSMQESLESLVHQCIFQQCQYDFFDDFCVADTRLGFFYRFIGWGVIQGDVSIMPLDTTPEFIMPDGSVELMAVFENVGVYYHCRYAIVEHPLEWCEDVVSMIESLREYLFSDVQPQTIP